MDQIHKQNDKLIKRYGRASNLFNKLDDSAFIRWELPEFEDFLDQTHFDHTESSTKHTEDSQTFHKRFSFHFDRLIKCILVNPFMQDHLNKHNNKKIIVREFMRSVINDL